MQKKRHSLLETIFSTAVGYVIAFAATMLVLPLFGFAVSAGQGFWITAIFTVISLIRGYAVRRLFNYLQMKELL